MLMAPTPFPADTKSVSHLVSLDTRSALMAEPRLCFRILLNITLWAALPTDRGSSCKKLQVISALADVPRAGKAGFSGQQAPAAPLTAASTVRGEDAGWTLSGPTAAITERESSRAP